MFSCNLVEPKEFEPLGGVTTIFFDDSVNQIFSVRSRGATGVIAKGFLSHQSSTFRLEDKGPIISIKLSPDQKVLSVQRNKSSVEFFNGELFCFFTLKIYWVTITKHFSTVAQTGVNGVLDGNPYEQACKTKNSTILGNEYSDMIILLNEFYTK